MMEDEAIAWLVRVQSDSADEATWQEFTAWLEADPAHRTAFDRVERFDAEIVASGRAIADMPSETSNVVEFGAFKLSRRVLAVAASLAAAVLIAVVVAWRASAPGITEYATGYGESKTISLADGSTVDLNTNTKIALDAAQGDRHVVLESGEALFHVTKDKAHPFVVAVGNRFVRVVGTVFDVLRNDGAISVVVAEGEVIVSPRAKHQSDANEIALRPGDALVYDEASARTTRSRVDPSHALAWRNGYLVYEMAPLSKVVGDLNRYYANKIVLANDGAAALRFSGVLKIDDEVSVLARLSQFLPVAASRRPDGTVMLRLTEKRD
jgi:transmembrane sensor